MSEFVSILSAAERGDAQTAEQLLPLVYQELRKLAACKLAAEKPGQILQATALVHEAYLRLVDVEREPNWRGRDTFCCCRRAMPHSDRPSQTQCQRQGGGSRRRVELVEVEPAIKEPHLDLLALNERSELLEKRILVPRPW